jgi:hypothetical protein
MRIVTATLCALVAALAFVPTAQAGDAFFGTFTRDMSHPAAQLAAEMNAQAATGVGTLREHLHWDRIERSPGVFDFTDSDALFAAAAARGMTVLPVLIDTPQFYSTRPLGESTSGWPPRDPGAIRRFAYELARRYGASGTYWRCLLPGILCLRPYNPIRAWQVWNEPDFPAWWRTGVDPGAYTALLQQAYEGLKAGDANAEVVLAGLTIRAVELPTSYFAQLYDRGAAPYFDSAAIHAYGGNVSGVVGVIQRMRAIAVAKGDGAVPIRATEYGFSTGGRQGWVTTIPCQAALIAATARELSARRSELGLKSIAQFQWQDRSADLTSSWPNFAGLLFFDGQPKPALAAFKDAVAGRPPAPGSTVPETCALQYQG